MSTNTRPSVSPQFSIVVPVYNSSHTTEALYARLQQVFAAMDSTFEVILVDDASQDDSWQAISGLARRNANVTAIQLTRNFGQVNAIMCGFRALNGEFVITLDDDLQNPPEEIPRLYAALTDCGLDVVYGHSVTRRFSPLRNLVTMAGRRLLCAATPSLHNRFSNYRLVRRSVIDALVGHRHDSLFIDGLISWMTLRTGHINVRHDSRAQGDSSYTATRLVAYFATVLFTFTSVPLRLIVLFGMGLSLLAFLVGGYYLYLRLAGGIQVSGFAALIVALSFFSGMQLLGMGIIAEYLGRIFLKQSDKPQFVVRQVVSGGHP